MSDSITIFERAAANVKEQGFTIVDSDQERPWGGFFVINEQQALQFARTYFPEQAIEDFEDAGKLSPKILVVRPGKRLSWQYHHRRAEIWKVLEGPVGVVRSDTDEQGSLEKHISGDTVKLQQGERHRLVGLDEWGLLAEIWQHTDPDNPSNEEDIVRVQDDFGR
ncbi:phosphoheptose isomerase [Fodinibius salsisoli]|uniref:Phosphoheptose isomerase n=1 Tax=Fodinibius salsisoli TaxID=2820877 RepID=A0ABT3PJB2_9BACT|nr:phosphoheptose isomerase [Fodinibius salsisoli]MCW9706027.1 phosphoheptose isomerase [Fodinibius salsisoli]